MGHHHKKTEKVTPTNPTSIMNNPRNTNNQSSCTNNQFCFFCIMKELNPSIRGEKISSFFKEMPQMKNHENVLVLSGLWNIAMVHPDNPEFPSLGIFECMAKLIQKGVSDKDWIFKAQNIYIPYYAAHIIGSYTMNKPKFAERAVQSGVIPPLMELMRGKMSWVEQRVAVRALGHLASYEMTFLALVEYEEEIVNLAMNISSTCLEVVYNMFVGIKDREKRVKYHSDLLTRGVGGIEIENKKAEEWASQLQCWSLYLLNCFAYKEKSLDVICNKPVFLQNLCNMWGGLVNDASSGGYGLLRILCYSQYGRKSIAQIKQVIESLGNLSRSSDDWQYIGIDCLLLLLKDPDTRYKVIDIAIDYLVDLIELKCLRGRSNIGQAIINILLSDTILQETAVRNKGRPSLGPKGAHAPHEDPPLVRNKVQTCLEEVRAMIKRSKREKTMSEEIKKERRVLVNLIKHQGNLCYWSGDIEEALKKYTEGLELCPLKLKRERIVLLSNRAQCHLLLRNPNAAIRDTTKALCITNPPNNHSKSLWRRSQAYDMKGLAKESLMDCIMFLNSCIKHKSTNYVKIPYHAARMISKQMNATWLFGSPRSKISINQVQKDCESDGDDGSSDKDESHDDEITRVWRSDKGFESGPYTVREENLIAKGGSEGRKEGNQRRNKAAIAWTL